VVPQAERASPRLRLLSTMSGSTTCVAHPMGVWLASLVHCPVHHTSLQMGCPRCPEFDPLNLGTPDHSCRCCGFDLTKPSNPHEGLAHHHNIDIVEEAYLDAFLREHSSVPESRCLAVQSFVDDMLQLLSHYPDLNPASQPHVVSLALPSRDQMFSTIAQFITAAEPSSDAKQRRSRHRQSLELWSALFSRLPPREGEHLEHLRRTWPIALRRRFESALLHQKRKHWPYSPFRGYVFRPGFKYSEPRFVRDLSAGNHACSPKSGI
jgi:hypothetical protein